MRRDEGLDPAANQAEGVDVGDGRPVGRVNLAVGETHDLERCEKGAKVSFRFSSVLHSSQNAHFAF